MASSNENSTDRRRKMLYYGIGAVLCSVGGYWCYTKLRRLHDRRKLVQFFQNSRRMISVGIPQQKMPSIRVMSYNILADGYRYALGEGHGYCPWKYRKWKYRFPRIMAQIEAYHPDIVGLQETTYVTYHNSLQMEFEARGYDSIHTIRDEEGHRMGMERTTETVLYDKDKFELLNHRIIRLNHVGDDEKYDEYFGSTKECDFRSKSLKRCPDVLVVLHLRLKQYECTRFECIVSSTHLHWDPRNPHIKLAQTLMLNHELYDLVHRQWKVDIEDIPMIVLGDFNALPLKTGPDRFDPMLEEGQSMVSGVYKLMTERTVGVDHEDHPRRKLREKIYRSIYYQKLEAQQEAETDGVNKENQQNVVNKEEEKTEEEIIAEKRSIDIEHLEETEKDTEKYPQLVQLEYYKDLKEYRTDIRWKSVYGTAGEEPVWTNHVPKFSGCIDYIFTNDNVRVLSYLEHPVQNGLSYHVVNVNAMLRKEVEEQVVDEGLMKKEKQMEIENGKTFPFMPNQDYPSDHLALVADLEFMPTKEETAKILRDLKSKKVE